MPQDRRTEGLLPQATTRRNIGVASLGRYRRLGMYSQIKERSAAAHQIAALRLQPPWTEAPIRNLSGGNQQKAVLGRWLEADVDTLLLSEPTRGVDVGARAEIYEILGRLGEHGTAILIASSDLDEVVGLADRIHVFVRGRVVATLEGADISHERVLEMATR